MSKINNKTMTSLLFLTIISASNISCAQDKDSKEIAATPAENTSDTVTDESPDNSIAHGEEAHKNHCYKCHTDDIYTRDDRFVKSIDALSQQVIRCKDGNDVPWFDEDADAVVQFLNKKYYKF